MKILNVIKEQNYFLFEILLILKFVAFLGPVLATGVLVQDKICLVTYHQSAEFCKNLQNPKDTAAEENVKHQILAESAKYNNYKTLVETLPLILWSLLLGPFLDTYPNSTFVIFFISILGDVLAALGNLANVYFYLSSPYLILLSSVSIWLTGGNMSFTTTAIMFITANSRESSRGIKFVLMEVIIVIGMAGATFISGQFLRTNAEGVQLRTYHYNYILTLSLDIIAIGLLFVLYMQKRGEKGAKMNATASTLNPTEGESEEEAQDKPQNGLKAFLNVDNARQTLVAFFRPRPRHVRLQIFLLCYIQFSQMAITTGLGTLMMQFSEAVYAWDPRTYATYSAFQSAAGMLMLAAMSGVFITWLKLADSTLILIAQLSNFLADLIRGTFLSPVAFFISIPIGCLNGFGIVSAKAKFSKIVPREDAGKIFTLNALIEGLVPLGTSLIYSNIFALSIRTYPGLIYHFSCALMILTVIALIIEKRFCPVTGQEMEEEEKEEKEGVTEKRKEEL